MPGGTQSFEVALAQLLFHVGWSVIEPQVPLMVNTFMFVCGALFAKNLVFKFMSWQVSSAANAAGEYSRRADRS